MTKQEIINAYHATAYNDNYIIGFELNKKIVACTLKMTAEMIDSVTVLSRASSKNGGGNCIRFRPNKEQKQLIMAASSQVAEIMEADSFESLYKETPKVTRGDLFEQLIANYYGGEMQTVRNLKYTDGGDVIISGDQYQCKFNRATWTTETTVLRVIS